ncbi:DUF2335 domain-containing protein [Aquabacterium sp. A08]|uniref:DUF2335 domain-containing protein n=1 Tax=Aquabacterium sp. A08 TaxID=2718532 RepID=UPI00142284C6|nr:DUF2335 domain-containing protein [Aquabacterium sp. A08]NIC43108.1 DUF2335 domain-containing protein [Aquabacterium sp. A08]
MSGKKPVQHTTPKPEATRHLVAANWSGPLPPPDALAQFNDIIPNGAERIMGMVENEQAHRIDMDRKAMRAEIWDTLGGKLLGAVMTLAAMAGAVYTAYIGAHWAVSVAIVGVPIMALIGKFVRDKT